MLKFKFKISISFLTILALLFVPLITDAGLLPVRIKVDVERFYITGGNSGVLVSSDEGQTWDEVGPNLVVNDLVVDNDNLFVATNQGIYRKLFSGSWKLISPNIWSTNLISKNNNYFLATVGSNIRLTNNPEASSVSWSSATINLPNNHSIRRFRQLETVGNYAYAIADGKACVAQSSGNLLCIPLTFYFGSTDSGKNWSLLFKYHFTEQFHSCLTIDSSDPTKYAYGGYDGIKVRQWDKLIAEENRWAVKDCQFIGQNLVIGSFDGFYGWRFGLQYSSNYGQTWHQSDLVDKIVYKVSQNRVNSIFYAIGQKEWNSQDLKLYKLNLSNIIDIKDYRYSLPKEMIFTSYIP